MKKVIYYFSGTGNSMRAAVRIAAALTDTEIISMRCKPSDVPAIEAERIGFVFPVYHWTMPEAAIRFVKGLRINPEAYIFAVSTPGFINGHSFEVLDSILREKGAALSYGKILYSVANLAVAYPPMPFPKIRVPKAEKRLSAISEEIVERKICKYPKAFALTRMLYPSVMPKYRKILNEADKGFIITDKCVSCGICAKVCPCKNIVLENGKPSFRHQCNFCMSCVAYCPKGAFDYVVSPEMKEKYSYPLIKMMKLPDRRKRYHNPFITAADIAADRKYIY
jgi:ferredoxin